jgi:hypothetical protein
MQEVVASRAERCRAGCAGQSCTSHRATFSAYICTCTTGRSNGRRTLSSSRSSGNWCASMQRVNDPIAAACPLAHACYTCAQVGISDSGTARLIWQTEARELDARAHELQLFQRALGHLIHPELRRAPSRWLGATHEARRARCVADRRMGTRHR